MSPTQRSLKYLRENGFTAEVVERWNQWAKVRQDLFKCIDIVALGNGETLGVQTTSYSNMSARIKKIKDSEYFNELKKSGWKLVVHGWKKVKNRYQLVERVIT